MLAGSGRIRATLIDTNWRVESSPRLQRRMDVMLVYDGAQGAIATGARQLIGRYKPFTDAPTSQS